MAPFPGFEPLSQSHRSSRCGLGQLCSLEGQWYRWFLSTTDDAAAVLLRLQTNGLLSTAKACCAVASTFHCYRDSLFSSASHLDNTSRSLLPLTVPGAIERMEMSERVSEWGNVVDAHTFIFSICEINFPAIVLHDEKLQIHLGNATVNRYGTVRFGFKQRPSWLLKQTNIDSELTGNMVKVNLMPLPMNLARFCCFFSLCLFWSR